MRHVAGRLPFFALVTQVGRKTGIVRTNPVNILERDGEYIIALTYGSDVNWLQNVIAAGGCEIRTRGRRIVLGPPRVVEDPSASVAPRWVRPALRLMGMRQYAILRPLREGGGAE